MIDSGRSPSAAGGLLRLRFVTVSESVVDITGPPTGDRKRPSRSTAAGRAAACREMRIGDCRIGAGQEQACVSQQSEARTGALAGPAGCYTSAQRLGVAESL